MVETNHLPDSNALLTSVAKLLTPSGDIPVIIRLIQFDGFMPVTVVMMVVITIIVSKADVDRSIKTPMVISMDDNHNDVHDDDDGKADIDDESNSNI